MKLEIFTQADAIRHAVRRMAVAICSTAALSWIMIAFAFGTNSNKSVSVGNVTVFGVTIGIIIAALLAGLLSYRSGVAMKELNQARAELLEMSHTDQLTGLLNRRGYKVAASRALSQASEAQLPSVVFMCDIDRFKAINDQFGHDFGDKVLVEISEAIRSFGEMNDMLVARMGGEEFAALIIDVTAEQAVQQANALRRICAATKILGDDGASARITVSIGIASSEREGEANLPEMMRTADKALYMAKHGGRNRVATIDLSANSAA